MSGMILSVANPVIASNGKKTGKMMTAKILSVRKPDKNVADDWQTEIPLTILQADGSEPDSPSLHVPAAAKTFHNGDHSHDHGKAFYAEQALGALHNGQNGKGDEKLLNALLRQWALHEQRIQLMLSDHEKQISQDVREWMDRHDEDSRKSSFKVNGFGTTRSNGFDLGRSNSKAAPVESDVEEFSDAASEVGNPQIASPKVHAWVDTSQEADNKGKAKVEDQLAKLNEMQEQLKIISKTGSTRWGLIPDDEEDGPRPCCGYRSLISTVVGSGKFESISCFFIVLNAVVIGLELDWELGNPGQRDAVSVNVFYALNICFMVVFTLELFLRICAEGTGFVDVGGANIGWNIFDTFLVLTSVLEMGIGAAAINTDISFLRLFRTLRLVRSFRIIRVVKIFKDLRIMLSGILHSLRSLAWAAALLVSIMYLIAVCLLQFASQEIEVKHNDPNAGALDADQFEVLKERYGSLPRTIFTLYLSICGGIDWEDAAKPMMSIHVALGLVFSFYIAFAVLCVLNIITGVFVENANRLTRNDDEMVLLEQMEIRKKWFKEVRDIFETTDRGKDGWVDREDFTEKMKDVKMQAMMQKIGVQVESFSADGLFQLLDFEGAGCMDIDDFALALQAVHGSAKSIDVAKIRKDTMMVRKELAELKKLVADIAGVELPKHSIRASIQM